MHGWVIAARTPIFLFADGRSFPPKVLELTLKDSFAVFFGWLSGFGKYDTHKMKKKKTLTLPLYSTNFVALSSVGVNLISSIKRIEPLFLGHTQNSRFVPCYILLQDSTFILTRLNSISVLFFLFVWQQFWSGYVEAARASGHHQLTCDLLWIC